MPTTNPRITFTVSQEMMDRIDAYRYENRIKNQTQAILSLIEKGLEVIGDTPKSEEKKFSKEELELIKMYRYIHPIFQRSVYSLAKDAVKDTLEIENEKKTVHA